MLQNAKVVAFTISELFKENQQGGGGRVKLPPSPPLRLGLICCQILEENGPG